VEVAKLRILVETDAAGTVAGFSRAAAAATSWERTTSGALRRVTGAFSGLSTGTKVFGAFALGAGALAIAMGATIGPAIEFESAFAGVKKTVDGTPAQLNAIRDGLIDLSRVMPTSASDLASIAENAGQLGIAAGDVLEFTEVIAKLGETTDLDFDSAAQSLARFLNVTGNDASISRVADVIVELGNNSATTESQIVTFATRLASSFTVAGASEDQILALGAAFSSLGVEAEAGSSSLSRVITQIADAAKLGGQDLEVFAETAGLLPDEFAAIAASNPVEALLLFGEGLGRVSDEGRSITPILKQLDLAGIRTTRVMQLLALGSDDIRDSLALASEEFAVGGAATEEYAKRAETTASRLGVLQNRLQAVAIELGTPALATFAQGADLAGDAIEKLVELLSPLATELGGTFSNLAAAAAVFFDVIGGPSLGLAVAAFNGLIIALTGVLSTFNALGPAGVALAGILAVITLFPAQVGLAATAVGVFGLELQALGVRGTIGAAGVRAVQGAIAIGPLVAAGAALALLGKAFIDAGTSAREAASDFRSSITESISKNDIAGVVAGLDEIIARREGLKGIVATAESGENVWVRLGRAIEGAGEILTPFTRNAVLDAKTELAALGDVIDEMGLDNFAERLELAGAAAGVSADTALRLGTELGVLDDLLTGGGEGLRTFVTTLTEATASERELADGTGILLDKILAQTASLDDYSEALGVTTSELAFLADQIEGVSLDDLLGDGTEALAALEAVESLLGVYAELADQIGISTEEYLTQIQAVENLADSHSALRQAIEGAKTAMELLTDQQRRAAEAREAYNEAIANVSDEESFRAAAAAASDLALELAGTGISYAEAQANQREFGIALIEIGQGLDLTTAQIIDYGAELFGLPPAVISEIILEAEKALADVQFFEEVAEETAREYLATMTADTSAASSSIADLQVVADAFPGSYIADLVATDLATPLINTLQGAVDFYNAGDYDAAMKAHDAGAASTIGTSQSLAEDFADGPYDAGMQAHDEGAAAAAATATGQARAFSDGRYSATLRADASQAIGAIRGAIGALAGFRSKTITLRTVSLGVSGTTQFSSGGISSSSSSRSSSNRSPGGSSITRFADGGVTAPGAIQESPHTADIYQAATPYRFFAEPVTGWEAFIPGTGDPGRNYAIWSEAGRRLGFMATGGIQTANYRDGGITTGGSQVAGTSIVISSPIHVTVDGVGSADARLARMVGDQVREGLSAAADDILNTRV
jgi:TP901 family phage tail tape measure protein